MSGARAPNELPPALRRRLAAAERWVVLTGAGISADSDVPTFREAQTGLWARFDAHALATPAAFEDNPALVWDWYQWRRSLIAAATPNAGHYALVELARMKPELVLVTQNVDGLHQRAGSTAVIEFHGNIERNKCFECGHIAAGPVNAEEHPPSCARCGGLLRPDVVWFGEPVPPSVIEAAFGAARQTEIFFSVGTSSLVYPAAALAGTAADADATVVEINTDHTALSQAADYRLDGSAASWLPAIAACVRETVS